MHHQCYVAAARESGSAPDEKPSNSVISIIVRVLQPSPFSSLSCITCVESVFGSSTSLEVHHVRRERIWIKNISKGSLMRSENADPAKPYIAVRPTCRLVLNNLA